MFYLKSLEKKNMKKDGHPKYTTEVKNTVYGYAIALQHWAYEAIVQLGLCNISSSEGSKNVVLDVKCDDSEGQSR